MKKSIVAVVVALVAVALWPRTRHHVLVLQEARVDAPRVEQPTYLPEATRQRDQVVPEEPLEAVVSVAVPDAAHKVSYEAGCILQSSGYEGGFLASFCDGVPVEEALAAVARAGLTTSDAQYRDGTALLVKGPAKAVELLLLDERLHQLWPEHPPVCNHNSFAAANSRVNQIQAGTVYELTGQSVTLAMWELGQPRIAHSEFDIRIIAQIGTQDFHATHVAGTMIASGVLNFARGMAPAATLRSYIVANSETANYGQWYAQRNNYVAANNSWGYETGWVGRMWNGPANALQDLKFGKYTLVSRGADDATEDDDVVAVVSAGNERSDTSTRGAHLHFGYGTQLFSDQHGADFQEAGYDTLPPSATAKNPIVVGAVDGMAMSSFSSWGPCDDGRLKPDLVAHGVNMFSTSDGSNTAYAWSSGTSMSAPVVTGTIGLLTQYMRGRQVPATGRPRLSMMKALLSHTAQDLGPVGPDYRHGYGLLDARKAADYLLADHGSGYKHLRTLTVSQGATQTIAMYVLAGQRVKVTMAWADRAGTANTAGVDDATRALVRDLNLRIQGPTGAVYSPWVLSRLYPGYSATTGNNDVDPIEQVLIASAPQTGWYQARVTFAGAVNPSVTQVVSLVLTHSDVGIIATAP